MAKHYVVGAGMVGCLYDFGPEACETHKGALDLARFYLEGCEDLSEEDIERILGELATDGIYYFTREERPHVGADYIAITEQEGECPTEDL